MRDERLGEWLGRIDPTGGLDSAADEATPARVLPLARLAVAQTVLLALIGAAVVVLVLYFVMRSRVETAAGRQGAAVAVPPGSVPAFSIDSSTIAPPGSDLKPLPAELVAWRYNTGAERLFKPLALFDEVLVVGSPSGMVWGLDPAGKLLWSHRYGGRELRGIAPGADDAVLYGSGMLTMLATDGEPDWELPLKDALTTRPQCDDGHGDGPMMLWYATADSANGAEPQPTTLHCSDMSDGSPLWTTPCADEIRGLASNHRGQVYAVTRSKKLLKYDYHGKLLWTYEGLSSERATPDVYEWVYAAVSHDGKPELAQIHPDTGTAERYFPLQRYGDGPLSIDGQYVSNVYIPSGNWVQVIGEETPLWTAGNDVEHALDSVVGGSNLSVLTTEHLRFYDRTGNELGAVPLGTELAYAQPGGLAWGYSTGHYYLALDGEVICLKQPQFMLDAEARAQAEAEAAQNDAAQ